MNMKITLNEIKKIVKTAINEQATSQGGDLYWNAVDALEKQAQEDAAAGLLDTFHEEGDDGIGPYEYGSARGFDSRPYNEVSVSGESSFSWPGDVDVKAFSTTVNVEGHDVKVKFKIKGPRTFVPDDAESNAVFAYEGTATVGSSSDDSGYDRADRNWSNR